MSISTISPQELKNQISAGKSVELIDVRTPVEFREVHVTIARNVPLDRLDAGQIAGERKSADAPLYVICRSGSRGKQACEKLSAAGLTNVVNVEGGTLACEAAGLPVIRGAKAMSLERQVRIAAGAMVVLGAALGFWVHPYWIALSAFVGAGLIFAGVTDTCGMAMLLARMPWNQVSNKSNLSGAVCRVGGWLLAIGLFAPAMASSAEDHSRDSLATVQRGLAAKTAVLVDVREKDEWDNGHLREARLIPLSVLQRGLRSEDLARALPKDKVIYLHCAAGGRCLQAAAVLKKQGYDVRPLKPGFDALVEAGFPEAQR